MGTALMKYKNNCEVTKLSDGKIVGGVSRLTDDVVVIIKAILKT